MPTPTRAAWLTSARLTRRASPAEVRVTNNHLMPEQNEDIVGEIYDFCNVTSKFLPFKKNNLLLIHSSDITSTHFLNASLHNYCTDKLKSL